MSRTSFSKKFEYFVTIARSGFVFRLFPLLLLNGFTDKGLEITRLSIQRLYVLKYKKRLKKFLSKNTSLTDNSDLTKQQSVAHNNIWVCWFQGESSMPPLVKKCFDSIKALKGYEVTLVDRNNFHEYTEIPKHVIDKWNSSIITDAHFSDILRADLLVRNGGIWLDATVYCSKDSLPNFIANSSLFLYQVLKPGRDGHSIYVSSWLLSSAKGNLVLKVAREYLFEYWKTKNRLDDYFLFHIVICAILDLYPKTLNGVAKVCNSNPHLLLLEMQETFNEKRYEEILAASSIHKLTYKYSEVNQGSYLEKILN